MPDLTAIKAVLNYEKHSYFYFAADAQNPGFHLFAKTLRGHNQNAKKYQLYLDRRESSGIMCIYTVFSYISLV